MGIGPDDGEPSEPDLPAVEVGWRRTNGLGLSEAPPAIPVVGQSVRKWNLTLHPLAFTDVDAPDYGGLVGFAEAVRTR